MRPEYDFSEGKRGAVLPKQGKSRITLYLDDNVIEAFRERAAGSGTGYQTLINQTLRQALDKPPARLDEASLRRIVREELRAHREGEDPHEMAIPA